MGGPEMLEWIVQSFVMHKRSRLPEYTSLQLKEKFVQGSHPCFAPLKERSGMPSGNQSEKIISADREIQENSARKPLAPIENLSIGNQYANDICIDTKETHEEGAIIPPTPNENLVSSSQGNGHSQCKILPAKNLLPAKRSKPASSANIQGGKCTVEQTMAENACYPCTEGTKKHKQDVICLVDKIGEHIAQDIEKEGYSFEKESTAGDLLAIEPPKDDNNMHTALKNLRKSCDNRHAVQLHHSDTEVPHGTNAKEDTNSFQIICVSAASEETAHDVLRNENGFTQHLIQLDSLSNEAEVKLQHYLSQDSSNGGPTNEVRDNIEHNPEAESCSDSDGYHEEKIEIAKKKSAFLSSQCTNSPDSFATADSKELNLCVKCNKDGKLLVCSSETCPVMVHDSCLGSVPILDKAGGFYCPFCAYSQAISKYLEVKKKVPHARNDLKSFFGLGIKQSPKHLSPRSGKLRQNRPQQDDESSENDVTISKSSSNKVSFQIFLCSSENQTDSMIHSY
ncbi:PREDICTED: uncharacterized protein LOC109161675 [Ipomoea nil]|uniref:uncharacterized protein LOC109161675 n=1 Tax=Ipomoea nil TaxID=35883 RepID=UPI0009011155|nr:PREDICTED: uncharacterized protein LOC109161675 [Ipomoea nil]